MSYVIAITGKGGVGKTTVAGLLVARLIAQNRTPVLAVDADPNSCLDAILGVRAVKTVGSVREDARELSGQGQMTGIAKHDLLNLKIAESLVEADDFDLIAMGRPEGPGCYCFANNVLRETIKEISANYPYVVIDNEAGLENLSRRIVQKVNVMVMVADPSRRGLDTVKRLYDLAKEMEVNFDKLAVLVNRTRRDELPDYAREIQEYTNADFILALPDDPEIADHDEAGHSVRKISEMNDVVARINGFVKQVLP
jgi:CO dehydrogenase maturation factor